MFQVSSEDANKSQVMVHAVTFVLDGDDGSNQLEKDAQLNETVEAMKQYLSSQLDRPTESISISYVGQ